jgi:hypothetical protein
MHRGGFAELGDSTRPAIRYAFLIAAASGAAVVVKL